MQVCFPSVFFVNFSKSYIYSLFKAWYRSMKKRTNAMAELHLVESIYRSLLLHPVNSGADGTIRLRHSLAKGGCEESQIALAKHLLTVVSSCPEERIFNAQSAIYWLLQAAKTAQEEALLLLKCCYNSGVGINAINCSEVEKCLRYSKEEKLARKVALAIYRSIMSETEELIPSDIFGDKIELLFQKKSSEKFSEETKDNSSQVITETVSQTKIDDSSLQDQKFVSFSDVVTSVQTCLEGNVPLVSLKQVMNYSEYKSWLSTKYIHVMWDMILISLERLIVNLSSIRLSFTAILMIIGLEFLSLFLLPGSELYQLAKKYENWLRSSLYILIMFSSSCYVVHINFGNDNVKRWLHLIKYFEPNIKSHDIQRKYLSKTIYPLLTFFLTSIFCVGFLPDDSISFAFTDIGFLSLFLMILVDRTIAHQRYFVNISLLLNMLTCLYKANIIQNSVSSVSSYLNLKFDYLFTNNLYLHLSFISCLTLPFVLPFLYFKMGFGKENRLWHLVLLPHLMSLTWMNLIFIQLSNTSSSQQFLSILSWLTILLLSNYTGFSFTLFLFTLIFISKTESFKVESLIFCLGFMFVYYISSIIIKKLKLSQESKFWSIIVCAIILGLSFNVVTPQASSNESKVTTLSWEKYQSYCHHNAWYRSNTAEVQISCLPLKGKDITLDGTVTSIDLVLVQNRIQLFADLLPEPFNSWFVCAIGESYKQCNSSELTTFDKERCKMYESLNLNQCHLHNWDTYTYQITLEVSSRTSPEVILVADHVCTSFVKSLKEGDSLEATARLDTNVGGTKPVLALKQSHCTSCYTNRECNISDTPSVPSYSKFSLKNIVWFYLSPLIKYKTD